MVTVRGIIRFCLRDISRERDVFRQLAEISRPVKSCEILSADLFSEMIHREFIPVREDSLEEEEEEEG